MDMQITNIITFKAQKRLYEIPRFKTSLSHLSPGLRISSDSENIVGLMKFESLRSQIQRITATELNTTTVSRVLSVVKALFA